MSWLGAMEIVLYLAAGAVLGAGYFALLHRTVRLHAAQAAALHTIPLYLVRFAAAIAAFWFIAQQGALPLLAALFGFLIARFAMQRRMG